MFEMWNSYLVVGEKEIFEEVYLELSGNVKWLFEIFGYECKMRVIGKVLLFFFCYIEVLGYWCGGGG